MSTLGTYSSPPAAENATVNHSTTTGEALADTLRLSLIAGVGPARLRKALGLALARQADLAELVEHRALKEVLTPHQLAELSCVGARANAIVEKLRAIEVDLISSVDAEYPAQMLRTWGEDRTPPLLMIT